MVTKKNFLIKVSPDGAVHIEVLNASGEDCMKWTSALEESLGEVKNRELKPEFYKESDHVETRRD